MIPIAVMIAISVAVSTRAGLVLNLVFCSVVFVGGHLTGHLHDNRRLGGGVDSEHVRPLARTLQVSGPSNGFTLLGPSGCHHRVEIAEVQLDDM